MFGTIEGIITPIVDTFKVRKEILTGELHKHSFFRRAVNEIFFGTMRFLVFFLDMKVYRAVNHCVPDCTSMHRHINICQLNLFLNVIVA